MKRPHQPDLVTGSTPNGSSAAAQAQAQAEARAAQEEIGRLEALCETRTKEVTQARQQLRHGAKGFQAMAAVVKYLTEQVGVRE